VLENGIGFRRLRHRTRMILLAIYGVVGFWIMVLFLFALYLATIDSWSAEAARNPSLVESLRNYALTLGAYFGIPVVLWRMELTADGQITDRFAKAVDQLSVLHVAAENSQPNIEARVGALHSLGRIAQDSLVDHFAVTSIICSYIRQHSQRADTSTTQQAPKNMRLDLDTALNVLFDQRLGSRYEMETEKKFYYDLSYLYLTNARLQRSKLWNVDFTGADLRGNKLAGADLTRACLTDTNLSGADLTRAKLHGCMLNSANLTDTVGVDQAMLNAAYGVKSGDGKTILPDADLEVPDHWYSLEEEVRTKGPAEASSFETAYGNFLADEKLVI